MGRAGSGRRDALFVVFVVVFVVVFGGFRAIFGGFILVFGGFIVFKGCFFGISKNTHEKRRKHPETADVVYDETLEKVQVWLSMKCICSRDTLEKAV